MKAGAWREVLPGERQLHSLDSARQSRHEDVSPSRYCDKMRIATLANQVQQPVNMCWSSVATRFENEIWDRCNPYIHSEWHEWQFYPHHSQIDQAFQHRQSFSAMV